MIRGFFYKFNRRFKYLKNVIFHVKLLSPTLMDARYKRNVLFICIRIQDKKNKAEEIQLANLASVGSLASSQSVAWYACEASLGKGEIR